MAAVGVFGLWSARRWRRARLQLVARVAELQALSDAVRAIASASLDEEELCELVFDQARKLVDTRTFQLGFFEGSWYDIRIRTLRGDRLPGGRVDIGAEGGIVGWMRDTGKPLLVRDFSADMERLPARPRSLASADSPLPRSAVFVPMVAGERVVGAMAIQSDRPRAYTDSHLRILSIIANQAAAAAMNARALARERERVRQLALVDIVAHQTSSILDIDALLPRLVEAIQGAFGYYFTGLFLCDAPGGEIECRAATHPREVGLRRQPGVGLIGASIASGKTICIADVTQEPRFVSTPHLPDTRSEAVVPLFLKDEVIGALDLQSDLPEAFSNVDQNYLEVLAQQVAVAVGDARLYEAEREQAWQSAALLQVADVARSAENLDDAMESIARLAPMLSGVDACAILTRLPRDGAFEIATVHGALSDHEQLAPGDEILVEDVPALETALLTRQASTSEASGRLRRPAMALPMVARDELVAVMLILDHDGGHRVYPRRAELLAGLANQAALVLDAVRANVAREEEAWATAALLEVAQAVSEENSVDEIADRVARLLPLMVGVDACAIFVLDTLGNGMRLGGGCGLPRGVRDRLEVGRPAWHDWLRDNAAAPGLVDAPKEVADALEIPHLAALPLMARGRPVGAMAVGGHSDERLPRDRALSILLGIAQQTALALDNARLAQESLAAQRLEHELSLARDIQRSFLPRELPSPNGWTVAADWEAARAVGGDFYDFIELQEEGRFGVAVADVADKGVPAALFMALSRSLLRGAAFSGREPNAVLKRVNRLVLADTRSDLFVTMFYGVVDTRTGEMHYANAGHNPPLIARADGSIHDLPGAGMAIGVVEQIEPPLEQILVAPGEALMLYTDGLVDALDATGAEFGMDRLTESLRGAAHSTAHEIAQAVMSAVRAHAGGELPFDDQTLVVIKRNER